MRPELGFNLAITHELKRLEVQKHVCVEGVIQVASCASYNVKYEHLLFTSLL
jgi:hypothetical protein